MLAQDLADEASYDQHAMVVAHSMRNRFPGLVTRVVRDTVMAQVEIQAGPHRFVSLVSREAADELGLEPGMLAVAAVKATSVSVEIPSSGSARPERPPGHQPTSGRITNRVAITADGDRHLITRCCGQCRGPACLHHVKPACYRLTTCQT